VNEVQRIAGTRWAVAELGSTWALRWGPGMLAIVLVACGQSAPDKATRIADLESKVLALEAKLGALGAAFHFDIQCPSPWQMLGPVGDAAWTCRKQPALADGFWPNCNVVEAPVAKSADTGAALSPKQAFEATLSESPQLQRARRISEQGSALGSESAHEAIYEHDLLQKPLRVLATVAVHESHAYAVSCEAPPDAFAANEAAFRQITHSFRFKP